jgi:hypothetical protein
VTTSVLQELEVPLEVNHSSRVILGSFACSWFPAVTLLDIQALLLERKSSGVILYFGSCRVLRHGDTTLICLCEGTRLRCVNGVSNEATSYTTSAVAGVRIVIISVDHDISAK